MERHTGVAAESARPPGYVGFDQGGAVNRRDRPATLTACCCSTRSRKAHPDLFNILLQVMELRKADRPQRQGRRFPQRHPDYDDKCRRLRPCKGCNWLRQAVSVRGDDHEAINRMFTPRVFRNRLDAIGSRFAALSTETIGRGPSTSSCSRLEEQLADRNVTIELDATPRDLGLAEKKKRL